MITTNKNQKRKMVSIDDLKRTEAKLTQRKQKKESNDGEEKKKSQPTL